MSRAEAKAKVEFWEAKYRVQFQQKLIDRWQRCGIKTQKAAGLELLFLMKMIIRPR